MTKSASLTQWQQFHAKSQGVDFVWVYFTTYIGTNLVRVVPMPEFKRLMETNQGISIPKIILDVLPHDNVADGGTLTGSFLLQPDLRSFFPCLDSGKAFVMSSWTDEGRVPLGECARSTLDNLIHSIQDKSKCSILVGFELEFCLLRPRKLQNGQIEYEVTNLNHTWSSMTCDDELLLGILEEVVLALQKSGIMVQQFHGERGAGQWELVLPPDSPLRAVDALVLARQTVMRIANKHGYRATLHPRISPDQPGTGAHVHISLNSDSKEADTSTVESFFAGILNHFPTISAFTLPQGISYERVTGGIGSGGDYVCWGWENRETILRRICTNRFEVKMMDGLANPYLGLSALLAAGLDGLLQGSSLSAGPCSVEPGKMSEQERASLGITTKMPSKLEESINNLEANESFRQLLGDTLVSRYLNVKRCEMKILRQMTPEEEHAWFISRY